MPWDLNAQGLSVQFPIAHGAGLPKAAARPLQQGICRATSRQEPTGDDRAESGSPRTIPTASPHILRSPTNGPVADRSYATAPCPAWPRASRWGLLDAAIFAERHLPTPLLSARFRTLATGPKAGGHALISPTRVATNPHDQGKTQPTLALAVHL